MAAGAKVAVSPHGRHTVLIAKLEGATGPDREIDARLWQRVNPNISVLHDPGNVRDRREAVRGSLASFPMEGWADYGAVADGIGAPRLTASLDAALALVEEKASDRLLSLVESVDGWVATLTCCAGPQTGDVAKGLSFSTPAIAVLIALLKALEQTPSKED